MESVPSTFLRSILGMPRCVPAAGLRLETGIASLECVAWIYAFRYWIKVSHANTSMGYLHLLQNDVHNSSWFKVFPTKLHLLGLSIDFLNAFEPKTAKAIIEKRIRDIDFQHSISSAQKTCSILHFGLNFNFSQSAQYLENLTVPKYWHVFSRARFNCLQSAILDGCYSGVPYENRLCPCNNKEIETLNHVIFVCDFYRNECTKLLKPIMSVFPGLGLGTPTKQLGHVSSEAAGTLPLP
ncbi:hypothetical protein JRQ81_015020 [Phrynocephalus forsythii]|uniref:Uncharacterized protein n=1 Tax=Phrynocephalus forsythii TaxID=171643 RepID=A0A9Q0XYU0_9SAUR|nr:hypothetical protein JRQ81_015020 [Phrynocephalus forsythii]